MKGATIFTGETGVGKTHAAIAAQFEAAAATGYPMLTCDLQQADNWAAVPHAPTLRDAVETLCGKRQSVVWTPRDRRAEFDSMMRLVDEWPRKDPRRPGFIVLVDEMYLVCNRKRMSEAFTAAARGWRHSRTSWFLTTQRIGDIHEDFYSVSPLAIKVFRTGSAFKAPGAGGSKDLEVLRDKFALNPDEIKALPDRKCLEV